MPKPISQRGFEISKGNYNRYQISYKIDEEGLENISVKRGGDGLVRITAEDGVVKRWYYSCSQFTDSCDIESELNKLKKASENFYQDCLNNSLDEPLNKSVTMKDLEEKLKTISEGYSDSYQIQEFINSMTEYIFSGSSKLSNPKKDIKKRLLDFEEKFKQASKIYFEVKKILNVDEELKNYLPRFSHEFELSLYNVLGLENVSQIKSFVEEETNR